ncbi:MAG: response regulator [Alcanivoracaceae bacterium]|jgi:ActR/RegA family two-component response regulator|nr:response regulator [Alcanivoracaceae bacterium]
MQGTDKIRILLADDEMLFAESTSELIRRQGYYCEHVGNAHDALEKIRGQHFDILVSDINMPANEDLSLLGEIRKLRRKPTVILVTGYPSVDTAVRSVEESVFAYKIKPFDTDDFMETLAEAARHSRFRTQMHAHTEAARAILQQLEQLQETLERDNAPNLDQTVMDYISLLMIQVAETSMEASSLIHQVADGRKDQPLRKVASHPDLEVLRNALTETVNVLERTKHAFKSRELGSLRKRLEQVINLTS